MKSFNIFGYTVRMHSINWPRIALTVLAILILPGAHRIVTLQLELNTVQTEFAAFKESLEFREGVRTADISEIRTDVKEIKDQVQRLALAVERLKASP